jgi:hypothetical protein
VFSTREARAGLVVTSQDFYSGSGSVFQGTLTPTTFTHGPFPQTATNSITFDSSGMHILGNVTGHDFITNSIFGLNQDWLVNGYTVTFQIDTAEPYTYTADINHNVNPFYTGSLSGPGGATISLSGLVQNSSGVLQPGVWTYNQDTATAGPLNQGPENYVSSIQNALLTVAPEPGTLWLLAIGAMGMSL